MSNCSNSSSSQLKTIQARLDRVDDDLIAHYAGISQLVAGLAANPTTSASVALSLKTYSFSSVGHTLLKKLVGLVPGYNQFKSLQHIDSASLVDGMGNKLASEAGDLVGTMAGQVASTAAAHADALAVQATAVANLAQGIKNNISQADRVALDAAVVTANAAVAATTASLGQVNQLASQLTSFLQCLTDIAGCKTRSSVIG